MHEWEPPAKPLGVTQEVFPGARRRLSRSILPEGKDDWDAQPDGLQDEGETEWTADEAWGEDEVLHRCALLCTFNRTHAA